MIIYTPNHIEPCIGISVIMANIKGKETDVLRPTKRQMMAKHSTPSKCAQVLCGSNETTGDKLRHHIVKRGFQRVEPK